MSMQINENDEHSARMKDATDMFVKHMESLYSAYPIVTNVLRGNVAVQGKKFVDFVDKHGVRREDKEERIRFALDYSKAALFNKIIKKMHGSGIAYQLFTKHFVVLLVSTFDAFLGHLIRAIFFVKPELLNSSQKIITFSQLFEFESLEDARNHLIEKEVDAVLRESHGDQFKWFEDRLGVSLTKLSCWATFIEVTERRNLFVHCNGVVSAQYLNVCRQNKVPLSDSVVINHSLDADEEYFTNAYKCIFEIGVKLSQVIWRKLIPNGRAKADDDYIAIIYELILQKSYDLAINVSSLADENAFKFSCENNKLMYVVNKAQAYFWNDDQPKCDEVLNTIDWSAKNDIFKLALVTLSSTKLLKRYSFFVKMPIN